MVSGVATKADVSLSAQERTTLILQVEDEALPEDVEESSPKMSRFVEIDQDGLSEGLPNSRLACWWV
jgi:hypothetical protein